MSDSDALTGWAFDEAVFAAAPPHLLEDLTEADRKLGDAQAVRASTTPWMERGDLHADRDASAALTKCEDARRRCMTALRQSLIDELADDRCFGMASFGSPLAKPHRVIRLLAFDDDAASLGLDGSRPMMASSVSLSPTMVDDAP